MWFSHPARTWELRLEDVELRAATHLQDAQAGRLDVDLDGDDRVFGGRVGEGGGDLDRAEHAEIEEGLGRGLNLRRGVRVSPLERERPSHGLLGDLLTARSPAVGIEPDDRDVAEGADRAWEGDERVVGAVRRLSICASLVTFAKA